MRLIGLIGLGGALGSILRYWLGGLAQSRLGSAGFPAGTLAVNVAGCLAIGLMSYLTDSRGAGSPETRAVLMVGLLGGFTTFSAFGNETLNLFRDGEHLLAGANVAANVMLGLTAVWLGRVAAHALWG
jgi:CrcB protein